MEFESYSSFWNQQAATPEAALAAVDGSASEAIVRRTGEWTARQVRTALDLQSNHKLLELGCGVGRIGRELAPHCESWSGTDISQAMLDVAQQRLGGFDNVQFNLLEATRLDMFERRHFDRAYTVAVLCHMDKEDLFLYLEELARVLDSGGMMYAETWNLAHPMGWKRWRFEVNNWRRADQTKRKNVARNQFCTPDELELYLHEAGFKVLRMWTDSPWIQVVAGNGLDAERVESERKRLDAARDTIVYSRQWGELFGELLDVIYGVTPPGKMLTALSGRTENDEVVLFRDYLLALWKQGEAYWGPAPQVEG
jgi:ubiquinone/menaquinone biosynthesis C-methylase UbiE